MKFLVESRNKSPFVRRKEKAKMSSVSAFGRGEFAESFADVRKRLNKYVKWKFAWWVIIVAALAFVGVVVHSFVFGFMISDLRRHTHPQCYGAVTQKLATEVNMSRPFQSLANWTKVNVQCVTFDEAGLVIEKDGYYELHGTIVVFYNSTTLSLFDNDTFGIGFKEVFRLGFVVNGRRVGNFGEGGFWRDYDPLFGPVDFDTYDWTFRSSASHHQHLRLQENDTVTLSLTPAASVIQIANFSTVDGFRDFYADFHGFFGKSYMVYSADLMATHKDPAALVYP